MSSIRLARRTLAAILSSTAAFAIAPAARADTWLPPFGRAGTVVLDDLIGLRTGAPGYLGQLGNAGTLGPSAATVSAPGYAGLIGYGHYTSSSSDPINPSVASDSIWFAPALDVFVAPRLSLGAALGVMYTRQTASDPPPNQPVLVAPTANAWMLSAVPRIGYVWPVAPRVAIWPRLGVGYVHSRSEQQLAGSTTGVAASATWLGGLDVKVVFQATRHVYFDAAPSLAVRYITSETVINTSSQVTHNFLVGLGGTVGMGVVL